MGKKYEKRAKENDRHGNGGGSKRRPNLVAGSFHFTMMCWHGGLKEHKVNVHMAVVAIDYSLKCDRLLNC